MNLSVTSGPVLLAQAPPQDKVYSSSSLDLVEAVFFGFLLSVFILGYIFAQTHSYFATRNGSPFMKGLVMLVVGLEICGTLSVFFVLDSMTSTIPPLRATLLNAVAFKVLLTGITRMISQGFLIQHLCTKMLKTPLSSVLTGALYLKEFVCVMAFIHLVFSLSTTEDLGLLKAMARATSPTLLSADFTIVAGMCLWHMFFENSEFHGLGLLGEFNRFVFRTGALGYACVLAFVVSSTFRPDLFLYINSIIALSGCYAINFLENLIAQTAEVEVEAHTVRRPDLNPQSASTTAGLTRQNPIAI